MPGKPPKVIAQQYDEAVALDKLTPHPANPNEGDQGLLAEVLEANGFGGAILAQASTGIIIDGETRWRTLKAMKAKTAPVIWMDVDDDTRDTLLAEWNETGRRGRNDESKLLTFLQGLAARPQGLRGAAFNGDDVDGLMARLSQPFHPRTDPPSDSHHSEDEDEANERAERTGNYTDRKQGGDLVELTLMFNTEDREKVGELIEAFRRISPDQDARAADLVMTALRLAYSLVSSHQDRSQYLAAEWRQGRDISMDDPR